MAAEAEDEQQKIYLVHPGHATFQSVAVIMHEQMVLFSQNNGATV